MIRFFVKAVINSVSIIFKKSKASFYYLLNTVMLSETDNYIDSEYNKTYPHIRKAISFIKQYNLTDKIILDIGAANGTTPKKFAENLSNEIWAFEPLEQNRKFFPELVNKYSNIKFYPVALGATESKQSINITSNVTSSSLKEINQDINKGAFLDKALEVNKVEEIEIKKLDNLVGSDKRVALIKIDVQGFELEVLNGAVETLKKTDLVLIEVSNHEAYKDSPKYFHVDEFMRANNFSIYDMSLNFRENKKLLEWDVFYINNHFKI